MKGLAMHFITEWERGNGEHVSREFSNANDALTQFHVARASGAKTAQVCQIGDDEDGSEDAILAMHPEPDDE